MWKKRQNTVIVVEDSSRSGLYERIHLKGTEGQGLLAKVKSQSPFSKITFM